MGIMNRFSSGVTNKVGNKVLNIEEIKEKSILPTTKEEIAERRAKAETIVTSAVLKVIIRDMAKRAAAKQTKWFPVVGQAVSASISYYFMNKLGREHIEKCEKVLHDII